MLLEPEPDPKPGGLVVVDLAVVSAPSFFSLPHPPPGVEAVTVGTGVLPSTVAAARVRYSSGAGDEDVRPSAARGGAVIPAPDPVLEPAFRPGPPLPLGLVVEGEEEDAATLIAREEEEEGEPLRAAEAAVARACAGVPPTPPPVVPPRRFSAFVGVVGVLAGFRGINKSFSRNVGIVDGI